jgi:hypothetical protein
MTRRVAGLALPMMIMLGPMPHELTPRQQVQAALQAAGVPWELHRDFLAVSYCESRWNPAARAAGHDVSGLFQIYWPTWAPWAEREGLGDFPDEAWSDPETNARLAYLIGEYYDMPRYGDRWHQWQAKPWWEECRGGVRATLVWQES